MGCPFCGFNWVVKNSAADNSRIMSGSANGLNYFQGKLTIGQPRLQCIQPVFPSAIHTLSTGIANGVPRIFCMRAAAVQV
jgi:hypothetical protein